MKTDSQLQQDVISELKWEPSLTAAGIGVEVTNGIVTLAGEVRSDAEKLNAESATQRVSGVKALATELKVRLLHTQADPMNILMVLTSHDRLGDTGHKNGSWLEEFAAPYYVFNDAAQTDATRRFKADVAAQSALATTVKLSTLTASDFDAVFYPGGRGPLWDLAEDAASIALIRSACVGHPASF